MPDETPAHHPLTLPVCILAFVASVWFLGQATAVVVPIIAAFFLATIVAPIQRFLQKLLPDALGSLGVLITSLVPVAAVALVVWGLGAIVDELIPDSTSWADLSDQLVTFANDALDRLPFEAGQAQDYTAPLLDGLRSSTSKLGSMVVGILLTLYVLSLVLGEAAQIDSKLRYFLSADAHSRLFQAIDAIGSKVRQFILMRTVAGLISGTLSGILFLVLDVPYGLLWALCVVALNYIPNIGSFIAAGPPILVATATRSPLTGLSVMAGMFCIEQLVGNVIDPRLQGRRLRLSPLMVLISVVFFTWLWGIPGTIIAVPCLVLTVVIAEQIPSLAPYAVLLRRTIDSDPLTEDPQTG